MMKRLFSAMLVAGVFSCSLHASPMNAPLVTERGPLRYDFALKKDKWTLHWWSAFYSRDANKAFIDHGTDTESLTKMMFGKDIFKIEEIFGRDPDDGQFLEQKYLFENRNPVVLGSKIAPRAKYEEDGVSIGARFEYPVWKNKGRVGIRANVPFKTVRIERDDEGECAALPVQDVAVRRDRFRVEGARKLDLLPETTANPKTEIIIEDINRYKLAMLTNLKRLTASGQIECAVNLSDLNYNKNVTAHGGQVKFEKTSDQIRATDVDADDGVRGIQTPFVVHLGNPSNARSCCGRSSSCCNKSDSCCDVDAANPPFGQPTGITVGTRGGSLVATDHAIVPGQVGPGVSGDLFFNSQDNLVRFGNDVSGTPDSDWTGEAASNLAALPADGSISQGKGYIFAETNNNGTDYSGLPMEDGFGDLWVSVIQEGNGKARENLNSAQSFQDFVEQELNFYEATDSYCWLRENCDLVLQSNQRTGIGDIDFDFFYEHTFNDNWRAEIMFGIRIPVASDNNICKNPFAVSLGNNDHWEVKIGGMFAWHAFGFVNIKADMYYSFVLEDTECRPAAFRNETRDDCCNVCGVRNFAPCVAAKVDWGYFVGRLDATWLHKKHNALGATFGYEIYYKSEDNVCFKECETANHCLGKVWANEDGTPITKDFQLSTGTDPNRTKINNPSFQEYKMALCNKNAERGTERIAHRLRWESNWRATSYLNLFIGGAYTFAGKNIPRESDFFAGFMTRW